MSPQPLAWIDSKYFEDHFSNASSASSQVEPRSSSDEDSALSAGDVVTDMPRAMKIRTPIFRVVLTGGPCAGKTTALSVVAERLRQRNIRVYVVPEVATMLFSGGATIPKTPGRTLAFQGSLLRAQMALEDSFFKIAESTGEPSLLLCDRGTMDGRAYMNDDMWLRLINDVGVVDGSEEDGLVKLRDDRYEMVVHMVTAAEGADEYYTLENNQARYESRSEAIDVDHKLREAWVGHPHLRVIPNNGKGFKDKIERVFWHVAGLFGLVNGDVRKRCVKRKFLIRTRRMSKKAESAVGLKEFQVEQTFLERGGDTDNVDDGYRKVEESVRRRGRGGFFTFVHQVRRAKIAESGVDEEDFSEEVVELKRQITNREYLSLLSHADPMRRSVRIKRQCFLYQGQYFVMDTPLDISPPMQLLRTYIESDVKDMKVPDWIQIKREVTGEVDWTMYALSMRVKPVRIMEGLEPRERYFSREFASPEMLFGTSV